LPQTQHSICKLPVIARIVRRRAELEKTLGPDRLDAAVSAQNLARRAGAIALARITLQATPLGYCTETDTTPAPITPSAAIRRPKRARLNTPGLKCHLAGQVTHPESIIEAGDKTLLNAAGSTWAWETGRKLEASGRSAPRFESRQRET
jgi:hypothetical protein